MPGYTDAFFFGKMDKYQKEIIYLRRLSPCKPKISIY